jgi:regulator of sigma E protease
MISFLVAAGSFAVMLCLLVFLHEWGHFAAARFFGVRVNVFSIGLGPRLLGWKRGSTEYRLSAIPLGGYVKMAGDSPFKPRTGAPDEFLSKTRWQRVVIALAGPAMNLATTFFLLWASFWLVGLPYPAYLTRAANVAAVAQRAQVPEDPEEAPAAQIHAGDIIVQVNGVSTPSWDALFAQAKAAPPGSYLILVVLRDGTRTRVTIKKPTDAANTSYLGYPLLQPRVDSVDANTPASKAGLKAGDVVASVNGDPLVTWPQFVDMLRQSSEPYPVVIVTRGKKTVPLYMQEPVNGAASRGEIGATPQEKQVYHRQGFVISGRGALDVTAMCAKQIVDTLRGLFSRAISVRELQGVIGIAQQSGQAASHGPSDFIDLVALISLNLGILNLLPIPLLDGSHILVLALEGALQRDIDVTVKRRFVQAGIVLLLGLSALAMFSDIQRLIQS